MQSSSETGSVSATIRNANAVRQLAHNDPPPDTDVSPTTHECAQEEQSDSHQLNLIRPHFKHLISNTRIKGEAHRRRSLFCGARDGRDSGGSTGGPRSRPAPSASCRYRYSPRKRHSPSDRHSLCIHSQLLPAPVCGMASALRILTVLQGLHLNQFRRRRRQVVAIVYLWREEFAHR